MPRFRSRHADPYWTTARFASTCSCGKEIKKGDRIFYYPNDRKAVCESPCGESGSARLQGEKSMDQFGTDIY